MKTLAIGLCGLVMFTAAGCGKSTTATSSAEQSDEPVTTVVRKPDFSEEAEAFSLSAPREAITLTQGEKVSVQIGINRGDNFGKDVAIALSDLPAGVTLETTDPVIVLDDKDATLLLTVAADAELGEFTVKITGQTEDSDAEFTKELKVTVAEK